MDERIRRQLDSLYAQEPQIGSDGERHNIKRAHTPRDRAEAIADLHRRRLPDLSAEVGFAYGFSTLHILDAMLDGRYGRHIAIDPHEITRWHGIGLRAVESLGFGDRFEFIEAPALLALGELVRRGKFLDFLFIDGDHRFDYTMTELFAGEQITKVGGLIVLDDLWLPSIKKVGAFVSANLPHLRRLPSHRDLLVLEKVGDDQRAWDTFVDF